YSAPTRERAVFTVTDNRGLSTSAAVEVAIGDATGATPPEFLSQPRKSIFAGEAYTYDKDGLPSVRGTGPFTFSLAKAPKGATVDASTGAITWTPATTDSGNVDFSLQVDGAAGSATQDWQVEVVNLNGAAKKGCGCGTAE